MRSMADVVIRQCDSKVRFSNAFVQLHFMVVSRHVIEPSSASTWHAGGEWRTGLERVGDAISKSVAVILRAMEAITSLLERGIDIVPWNGSGIHAESF